ncbi:MAG: DcrB-related protein [Clostridia bacterium]|nr:DcrB-related protein [Clostridia bacterium]
MKKMIFALIAACMIFSLCACGSGEEPDVTVPEGMVYVKNDVINVALCHPFEWTVDRNDGMLSLLKDTSSSSMVSTYASLSVTKYGTDAQNYKDYWKTYEERLSDELKEYKAVKTEEIKVDGNTAGKYHYTAKVDGNTYHFVQVVAVGGYSAYIITLTASEKDFESVNADFDKIISNFYFN